MTVIKRDRISSSNDLIVAIEKLNPLLEAQEENDAVADLERAKEQLKSNKPGSDGYRKAIESIIDAFDGEHELNAYTMTRQSSEWSEADALCQASVRVLNLARRMLAATGG